MNDLVEKRNYYCELYNLYSELLNDVTKNRFHQFYFEDLSLSEIAEKEKVSRNAIHLSIKKGEKELISYENKLKLFMKSKKEK